VKDVTAFKLVNKDIERFMSPLTIAKLAEKDMYLCAGNRHGFVLNLERGNYFYVTIKINFRLTGCLSEGP